MNLEFRILNYELRTMNYQMLTRFSGAKYIGDSGVTFQASYQAPICGSAPFTRHMPSE